jgi:hypothetical protein
MTPSDQAIRLSKIFTTCFKSNLPFLSSSLSCIHLSLPLVFVACASTSHCLWSSLLVHWIITTTIITVVVLIVVVVVVVAIC